MLTISNKRIAGDNIMFSVLINFLSRFFMGGRPCACDAANATDDCVESPVFKGTSPFLLFSQGPQWSPCKTIFL